MIHPPYDLNTPMTLHQTLAVYEDLRGMMPSWNSPSASPPLRADRLSDLFDHVDALLLDGFGVLNVGNNAVSGANAMLAEARRRGITPMVLTNGASKDKAVSGMKYQHLGIDIDPDDVISSRDALIRHLAHEGQSIRRFGVIDSFADPPSGLDMTVTPLSPDHGDDWLKCDAIGFFGALHWTDAWQSALTRAMAEGVKIMVANPDAAAPLPDAFSREPAFWVAKALNDLNISPSDSAAHALIDWFGKPYTPIFDLAIAALEQRSGHSSLDRKRIAMVGDTLHTDILGGHAAGLATVLVTGHGLFRDGGADDSMASVGITPDYIVTTV